MEKPNFVFGSEEGFLKYYDGLKNASGISLVSHTDLDGIASAKVVATAVNPNRIYFVNYHELNDDLVNKLNKDNHSHVIFTDLFIKDQEFLKRVSRFSDVLVIDHHFPEYDLNKTGATFLNAQNYCAAYLSYYLFSKVKKIESLDWLVACACISDVQHESVSGWMNSVYQKYNEEFDGNDIKKGRFWGMVEEISMGLIYFEKPEDVYNKLGKNFGDIGDLAKYSQEVKKEIDNCISRFNKEKVEIKEGYFWEFSSKLPVKSYVTTALSFENPDKTIIIAKKEGERYLLSARRQDKKTSMNELLRNLVNGFENAEGGGHIPAAGGHIMLKDAEKFKERVKKL